MGRSKSCLALWRMEKFVSLKWWCVCSECFLIADVKGLEIGLPVLADLPECSANLSNKFL